MSENEQMLNHNKKDKVMKASMVSNQNLLLSKKFFTKFFYYQTYRNGRDQGGKPRE